MYWTKRGFGLVVLAVLILKAGQADAQDPEIRDGRRIFHQCRSCHNFTPNRQLFGPSLKGVVGRRAGSVPDFPYSDAMKAKGAGGLVWTEETLSAFLANPKASVHRTAPTSSPM